MGFGGYSAAIRMAGMDDARKLADEIHEKSRELSDLVYEFNKVCLELGIELVPSSSDPEPTKADR